MKKSKTKQRTETGKQPLTEKQRLQRIAAGRAAKARQSPEERRAASRKGAALQWADRAEPPANAAEIILRACDHGCTHERIAGALGVGRGTLRQWLEEYPELKAAMSEGRQVEHDKLVGKLFELAIERENLTAILFALKARFGYREGEAPVQNTVSVNFILPKSLTPEEYAAKLARESQLLPAPDAARFASRPEVQRELAKDLKPEVER